MRADMGGGGPGWNGTITVVPGDLATSAPDFTAAGDQILEVMASTVATTVPAAAGITDGGAAEAWTRMARIWTGDLESLSAGLSRLGTHLAGAGEAYATTDAAAVPLVVRRSTITGG